jgi:hypothetical protein
VYVLSGNLYDTAACPALYGSARDADHDGLCDAREWELARRAAPLLKWPAREPLLDSLRTLWQVHNAGPHEVVISYVQAYVADLKPIRHGQPAANHPGDSEEVRYWLYSRDGREFRIVRAHYWHHKGGQDWAENDPEPSRPLETELASGDPHPVVWVQQFAHGSYLDRATCERDPEGDGEPCGDGLRALAPLGKASNVGEADAHILGDDRDASAHSHIAALGFPGESPWDERHNGFAVRGFCGGLPGTGLLGGETEVAGERLRYRRRILGPVCAGPLAAQWDRKPAGTEDIIYWQGFHSRVIAPQHGAPALAGDVVFVRDGDKLTSRPAAGGPASAIPGARLTGEVAAATFGGQSVLAYRRQHDGVVVTRTADGVEHATGASDPEVALAVDGAALYLLDRAGYRVSRDGGRSFASPVAWPRPLPGRPSGFATAAGVAVVYRDQQGALLGFALGDPTHPRALAPHAEGAPWAVATSDAAYVFYADHGKVCYRRLAPDGKLAGPVEIPGAETRRGGAAAAIAGRQIRLVHESPSGLATRLYDPDL